MPPAGAIMDKVRNLMKKLKTLATTGLAWAKAHPVPVAIVLGVIVILYGTFMVAALRIRHRVADYLSSPPAASCNIRR